MRHLLTILASLLLCSAPLHAQTLKSLMFNSTNGQVVANTGTNVLTFMNDVKFGGGELSIQSQNISGGAVFFSFEDGFFSGPLMFGSNASITFLGNVAATTRANLGFSTNLNTFWTATNTASAARALGGSTNTNEPYSGTVELTNTNVLTFSNGVLLKIQ